MPCPEHPGAAVRSLHLAFSASRLYPEEQREFAGEGVSACAAGLRASVCLHASTRVPVCPHSLSEEWGTALQRNRKGPGWRPGVSHLLRFTVPRFT